MNEQEQYEIFTALFIQRVDVIARHNDNHWGPYYRDYRARRLQPWNSEMFQLHLNGKQRLGSYSTTPGENTCKFIVADFDENRAALYHARKLEEELQKYNIRSFLERSRSGCGYHQWVFFVQPIVAFKARAMMLGALHLAGIPTTGEMRKGVNTTRSFDRLFPNQDTVPVGGFGNLIALPLQGAAMQQGNTVFLDMADEPFPNQWEVLRDIYTKHRLALDNPAIEQLAVFATENGSEITKPITEVRREAASTYWSALAQAPGQIEKMQQCEAIKQSVVDADQFGNHPWTDVLSNVAVYLLGKDHQKAQELAHKISRGYQNYTEDETNQVLRYKLDHLQRDGWPTSCRAMAEHGWTCPRLSDCRSGFIAKYGAPPSFTVHNDEQPIPIERRRQILRFEQSGLYDAFRACYDVLSTTTDSYILRHLLGIRELFVECRRDEVKSFKYTFPNDEQAAAVALILQGGRVPHDLQDNQVWLLRKDSRPLTVIDKVFVEIAQQAGVIMQKGALISQILGEGTRMKAPFFGKLDAFVAQIGLEEAQNAE